MAALTRDRNTPRQAGEYGAYPVAAGVRIYAGSLVAVNAAGYAMPAADAAGARFVGVARHYVDNSGGVDGAAQIEVWKKGVFLFSASGLTAADVGAPVFAADDQTVAKTTANGVGVGVIVAVESATSAWVDVSEALRRTAQAQAAVAAPDATPAAGANPTKAEFDAVVTLANETKAAVNGLLAKLRAAGLMGQ